MSGGQDDASEQIDSSGGRNKLPIGPETQKLATQTQAGKLAKLLNRILYYSDTRQLPVLGSPTTLSPNKYLVSNALTFVNKVYCENAGCLTFCETQPCNTREQAVEIWNSRTTFKTSEKPTEQQIDSACVSFRTTKHTST